MGENSFQKQMIKIKTNIINTKLANRKLVITNNFVMRLYWSFSKSSSRMTPKYFNTFSVTIKIDHIIDMKRNNVIQVSNKDNNIL